MGTTANRGYVYPSPYTATQDVRQAIEDLALSIDSDMATINGQIGLSLNSPSVSLSSVTPQPVPTGTAGIDLEWTIESYDNDAMFEPAMPDQIAFNTSGLYLLSCMVGWAATGDATIRDAKMEFVTDGAAGPSPASRTSRLHDVGAATYSLLVPYPVVLAGETLKVHVTHDDDASLDVISARLTIVRIGRLDPL